MSSSGEGHTVSDAGSSTGPVRIVDPTLTYGGLRRLSRFSTHHLHKQRIALLSAELEEVNSGLLVADERLGKWCQRWDHIGTENPFDPDTLQSPAFVFNWYQQPAPHFVSAYCKFCGEQLHFASASEFYRFLENRARNITRNFAEPSITQVLHSDWASKVPFQLRQRKKELQRELVDLSVEVWALKRALLADSQQEIPDFAWREQIVEFARSVRDYSPLAENGSATAEPGN
jgi:hypothetical protein